jgi:hypothetical protein
MEERIIQERFLSQYLTPLTTIISIISAIVYITMYVGTMDKRIAVIENQQDAVITRVNLLKDDIETVNTNQSDEMTQFHNDVSAQLAQMGQRIEKIYSVLLDSRKHHAV